MLKLEFKVKDAGGAVRDLVVSQEAPDAAEAVFSELSAAVREKRKLKFCGAKWLYGGGASLDSGITEKWSVADMRRYFASCDSEAVFLLCEKKGTRKAVSEKDSLRIAPLFDLLDIPAEWKPYIDMEKAAADARNGAGPLFRPDLILLADGNAAIFE